MEKVVKAFERVNTSKGGRAIPEDQRPDCFFFVAGSDDPHTETTLSSILPCVDEQTTNQTLAQIKVVINIIVTVVNTFVYALANTNPSPGQNFYYNQSRPPMPPLCSSFDSNMEDRECSTWELSIGNASSVWESYICEVTKSDVCTTVGRVTPEIYKQLVVAVNESYALEHYTPPLLAFGIATLEEVFADPHRPQVKDLSSGNWFDNGRSNDETKRYAEVV
ncbi:hypothetical protein YC2023_042687 [Brassica napus]